MISMLATMYFSASCIVFPFVEELTNTQGGKAFGDSLLKDESSLPGTPSPRWTTYVRPGISPARSTSQASYAEIQFISSLDGTSLNGEIGQKEVSRGQALKLGQYL
jgi:hypothetical protein